MEAHRSTPIHPEPSVGQFHDSRLVEILATPIGPSGNVLSSLPGHAIVVRVHHDSLSAGIISARENNPPAIAVFPRCVTHLQESIVVGRTLAVAHVRGNPLAERLAAVG